MKWMVTSVIAAMLLMVPQAWAQQKGDPGDNANPDADLDRIQDMGGTLTQNGPGEPAGPGDPGEPTGPAGPEDPGSPGGPGEPGVGKRPEDRGAKRPEGEWPEPLLQQLTEIRAQREALLNQLKAVLAENKDATQEQRRQAVEEWRAANKEVIEQQRQLAQSVKEQIREFVHRNRPEDPEDPENPIDPEGDMDMNQIREQNQARKQAQQEFRQQMQNATSAEERQEIVWQYQAQRQQQIQERKMEILAREGTLNRKASIEALRQLLQTNAETLRSRARLQQRDEALQQLKTQTRQTVRERNTVQDREEIKERPDQPDRPERPERPDQNNASSRRERLEERANQ